MGHSGNQEGFSYLADDNEAPFGTLEYSRGLHLCHDNRSHPAIPYTTATICGPGLVALKHGQELSQMNGRCVPCWDLI